MRLGARRKCGYLFMPDMDPLDLVLPADRIGKAIQAVADDSIDTPDANSRRFLVLRRRRHLVILSPPGR